MDQPGGLASTQVEAQNAAALQLAIKQSLKQAALERELEAISEQFSQPCYNTKLQKTEPYHNAFLRNLFGIRYISGEREKFQFELDRSVINILTKLRQKTFMSAEFAEKTHIELILQRIGQDRYCFSAVARGIAQGLHHRFAGQNWGRNAVQPAQATPATPATPAASDEAKKPKRKRDASSPSAKSQKEPKQKKSVDEIHITKPIPADDDPIFGLNGPMRGTLIKYNTVDPQNVAKSIVLNPNITQTSSKVFGHNGIRMGQFFPRQMAALAQGAHGSSQAGISGTAEDGAYSVIVTGKYSSLEKDGLDKFEYCATGSMENTFKDSLIESQGLKTMRRSLMTKKPVRVLRGENTEFRYAPKVGLRYDGLYTVAKEEQRVNGKGGVYAVFVLEQVEGQAPVDLSRPNAGDIALFGELKERLA
ncbi:hypothetical protein EPUS_02223 [Endocarpon pusillum Z07020]|uniref:YDG domain-containing protein n=1 Tax=Endocarpon pusillum (strain Z07020 / HMAS-L-300199) TaxID=1263415 RepID=U1I3R1_ENDPU|nr:uncharacterized protein EPUS_02223 [Endocarpon pusillum Z07020]ERF76684.1 hypothetical protein EPUS_02223 [Endocarpon pusillum Z07020]